MYCAIVASKLPNNMGHVLVEPNEHFENFYELTAEMAAKIHSVAQVAAFALKNTDHCDGNLLPNIMSLQEIKMYGIIIFMYIHDMKMITYTFQKANTRNQMNAHYAEKLCS